MVALLYKLILVVQEESSVVEETVVMVRMAVHLAVRDSPVQVG